MRNIKAIFYNIIKIGKISFTGENKSKYNACRKGKILIKNGKKTIDNWKIRWLR